MARTVLSCYATWKALTLHILSVTGVAQGSQVVTVQSLFHFLYPMLSEFAMLVGVYHNYQQVVELILELYCNCAHSMLCYLSQVSCEIDKRAAIWCLIIATLHVLLLVYLVSL
jgi:hypothetical protein